MNNDREIRALVIGKSGTGKSSFILSIMDKKQRQMIPAVGRGQTTRSSMEYHIINDIEQQLNIKVTLKTEKEFVDERQRVVTDFLSDNENFFDDMKRDDVSYFIDDFKDHLIYDNAFFSIKEFGLIEDDLRQEDGDDIFSVPFLRSIGSYDDKLERIVESYFKNVYNECRKRVRGDLEFYFDDKSLMEMDKERQNEFKQNIGKFFKVMDDGLSFSSLVKKIEVSARVSVEYSEMMKKYRLKELLLVDTYGLDHDVQMNKTQLQARYEKMLRNDYKNVQTVLYLRNINSSDSPSDLEQGITTLFRVEPSVHPYIIFTYWDKFYEEERNLEESKAYKMVVNLPRKIIPILLKDKVSTSLAESRMNELKSTIATYASVGIDDDYSNETISTYYNHNVEELNKIFRSILYKDYLGKEYLSINVLKQNTAIKEALLSKNLFKSVNLRDYPGPTKGAIHRRIQPLNGRILGFAGSTTPSAKWSDLIAYDLNSRFTNLDVDKLRQEGMESVCIEEIEELFVSFSKKLYQGSTNEVDSLDMATYGNQITMYLYNDRKNSIDNNRFDKVGDYLSNIYDFESINSDTIKKISDTLNNAYDSVFLPMCRMWNAQKLAENINDNTKYSEKEEILKNYYENYDSDLLDSLSDKEEFEIMVSDNLEV